MSKNLNTKQLAFCQEYMVDKNATQAAIRAGYSQNSAGSIGSEILQKPEIKQYIDQLQDEQAARTAVTADRIIQELARVGFSNMADYFDDWGTVSDGEIWASLKDFDEIPDEMKAAIRELTIVKTTVDDVTTTKVSFKLHDKLKALLLLMKHKGMFDESVNIKAENPIIVVSRPQLTNNGA